MKEELKIGTDTYQLKRYPTTTDKSLRAWSNAELLAIDYISGKEPEKIHLFNDRFGVWNCTLNDKEITTVWTYASQQKAVCQNLERNGFSTDVCFKTPLEDIERVDLALIKIPKSLELFQLFLQQIYHNSHQETEVVCGFMVKYFSASFLRIANLYFDVVEQTRAWKKARLLILKKPKKDIHKKELLNVLLWKEKELKQYYGVFSSGSIDIGTRFFLDNLKVYSEEIKVLDLASGNGVIGYEVTKLNKKAEVTLIDDFNLAIASSKLNLSNKKTVFVCAENLAEVNEEYFDLVVSNPPFHFEYENNIEVSLLLFKGVEMCLKSNGRFLLVANIHLNYETHLCKIFRSVNVVKNNDKFIIYECLK